MNGNTGRYGTILFVRCIVLWKEKTARGHRKGWRVFALPLETCSASRVQAIPGQAGMMTRVQGPHGSTNIYAGEGLVLPFLACSHIIT